MNTNNEDITNYQKFTAALNLCMNMANEYLHRCIIDGRVSSDSLYYFQNLVALTYDNVTRRSRIICSNTNPDSENESIKSYNLRFVGIDEDLFNKSSEEFDKAHLDQSLLQMIKLMNSEEKLQLYDALRDMIEDELQDIGGL